MADIHLITELDELQEVVHKLRQEDWIAIDTEFIRESSFFPDLQIIQLASRSDAWLVDVQAWRKRCKNRRKEAYLEARLELREAFGSFIELLEDPGVVKVFHAAQGDQECLYTAMGTVAKRSFDTAVGASLLGYGEGVGLGSLMQRALGVKLRKGHARTNWAARPLPPQLREYAIQDVLHLVELAQGLAHDLEELGRLEWGFELSSQWENPQRYEPDPEASVQNLFKSGRVPPEGYGVLFNLMSWREKRVREMNVPRKWLADDAVLMDLSRVRPKDMGHLKTFRGLNRGELNRSGADLLDLIEKGVRNPAITPPTKGPRKAPATTEESRAIDLLKAYLALLADENRISVKNLITVPQMLGLLRSGAEAPQDLVEQKLLSQGAANLVGREVIAFLQGKRALRIDAGAVRVTDEHS